MMQYELENLLLRTWVSNTAPQIDNLQLMVIDVHKSRDSCVLQAKRGDFKARRIKSYKQHQ